VKRLVFIAVAAIAGVGAAAPQASPPARPIAAGVTVGAIKVGGLSSEHARTRLAARFGMGLRLSAGDRSWVASPQRLGATAAVDSAVSRALRAAPGTNLPLEVRVDRAAVRAYVARVARLFHAAPVDAKLVGLSGLRPNIADGKPGHDLDRRAAVNAIAWALRHGSRHPMHLPLQTLQPTVTAASFGPVIVIERGVNRLTLYDGTRVERVFAVATGQAAYPTPAGWWSIVDMQRNPWWRPPDSTWAQGAKPIPPGPGNPLGTRWMGLSAPAVGIHGTPDAASIGYSASHGCIRMQIPDAEWLFEHVHVGTNVFIV
jgi:lipoprotein-anchoring transpeptidase ErfK/SrfK